VCRHCRRWNLAPIEARWEALEELDRATRDKARLLAQTENIALYEWGEIELVRVGRAAERAEEAWWRYGRELVGRRDRFKKVSFVGTIAVGAAVVGGWTTGAFGWLGAYLIWEHGGKYVPRKASDAMRWLRFGSTAWRGDARCPNCGTQLRRIAFADRDDWGLAVDEESETIGLVRACPRCGHSPRTRGVGRGSTMDGVLTGAGGRLIRLDGPAGERAARRVLAYHHFAGASERRVIRAAREIETAGSALDFARLAVGSGRPVNRLDRTASIAMEISANEAAEQRLLQAELAELEHIWREEERIAAIADGELTPVGVLESLRLRITGQNVTLP
jgi:hypothetical protein